MAYFGSPAKFCVGKNRKNTLIDFSLYKICVCCWCCLTVSKLPSAILSPIRTISCLEINESKNPVTLRFTKKRRSCSPKLGELSLCDWGVCPGSWACRRKTIKLLNLLNSLRLSLWLRLHPPFWREGFYCFCLNLNTEFFEPFQSHFWQEKSEYSLSCGDG